MVVKIVLQILVKHCYNFAIFNEETDIDMLPEDLPLHNKDYQECDIWNKIQFSIYAIFL